MPKRDCSNEELFEYLEEYDEDMWPCHEVVKRMKALLSTQKEDLASLVIKVDAEEFLKELRENVMELSKIQRKIEKSVEKLENPSQFY